METELLKLGYTGIFAAFAFKSLDVLKWYIERRENGNGRKGPMAVPVPVALDPRVAGQRSTAEWEQFMQHGHDESVERVVNAMKPVLERQTTILEGMSRDVATLLERVPRKK